MREKRRKTKEKRLTGKHVEGNILLLSDDDLIEVISGLGAFGFGDWDAPLAFPAISPKSQRKSY